MAAQPSPIGDDSIQWTKATSTNGVPFEYGIKKSVIGETGQAIEPRIQPSENKARDMPVNWPVGDDVWVTTQGIVAEYISQYELRRNTWSVWAWRLDFKNIQIGYYTFTDKTGDAYSVPTFNERDHFVRYNSTDPTIQRVHFESL